MPQEAFEAVHAKLVRDRPAPEFKRVVMSLHDILSGDFFAEYIKKGTDPDFGISLSLSLPRH
jgi:ribonucleases P/MRP protein subunit RPP40